jgi:hypothetical protein
MCVYRVIFLGNSEIDAAAVLLRIRPPWIDEKTGVWDLSSFESRNKHNYANHAPRMRGFLPLLNGLLDAANLLKYVQDVRRYFCA